MTRNYYVKERLMGVGAKFDVLDENENEVFFIEADKFDIGKNITIYSVDKSIKYLYLKQRLSFGKPKYTVFTGDGEEIGTIKKALLKPEYTLTSGNDTIVMKGASILGRNYSVSKNNDIIGNIDKETTLGRDRYKLQVIDEEYAKILIGLVIVVDMVRFSSN